MCHAVSSMPAGKIEAAARNDSVGFLGKVNVCGSTDEFAVSRSAATLRRGDWKAVQQCICVERKQLASRLDG